MKKQMRAWFILVLTGLGLLAHAQNDGDHCITDGFGRTYLAPDALVGLGILPFNMTVGNAPSNFATLSVRGDQLPVNDAFSPTWRCSFRTDGSSGFNQTWDMVRGGNLMGRIFHTNPGNSFTIRSMSGPMRVRNEQADGIHDGAERSRGPHPGPGPGRAGHLHLRVG